ncbi:MAG TPA: DegQ family serine endoprotease [Arenibaculum sp.]|nr:DegQ family serine endoprotease [Arenibaculum sp.]
MAGVPGSFAELAERQIPTVVNISTTQAVPEAERPSPIPDLPELPPGSPFEEFFREFWGQQDNPLPHPLPRPISALGSGFIIDPSGLVVTNNHVVAEADEIKVILHDETAIEAELVGADPMTDLAILRVDAGRPLPAAVWGDSDLVRVGDWVLAIGNPFGLGGTVTSGILSARARDINQGPYDEYLQTDASINRGNSGGPLLDTRGRVIGINTAIFSPTGGSVGIGFAIPSSLARPVIEDIIRYGSPRRGWLGVQIQALTEDVAESLGMEEEQGALVTMVTPGGPAERAGIRQGDVIVSFDGKEIDRMRRLPRAVAETEIGAAVPVIILRDGNRRRIEVTVGDLEESQQAVEVEPAPDGRPPASRPGETEEPSLGLTLAPLTEETREAFGILPDATGVVVTGIAEGKPAAEQGVQAGDVIVEVGRQPVGNPSEVADRIRDARDAGRRTVLILVDRGGDMRFVALPLPESPSEPPSEPPG